MSSKAKLVFRMLIIGVVLPCIGQPAFAQRVDVQLRIQMLKAKIRQIVVDESIVKTRATITATMKGHVDVITTFENLKPEVQTEARREGFAEGNHLSVRINAETLTYAFHRVVVKTSPAVNPGIPLISTPVRTVPVHEDLVDSVLITSDGKTLITGSRDKTIKFWSVPEAQPVMILLNGKKLAVHSDPMAITSDGKILASAADKYSARLWSVPEGRLLASLEGHTNFLRAIAISPDNTLIATGGQDNTIKLWSIPDGRLMKTLLGHSNYVNALAITPDGKTLVSGSSDSTISLWSLPDGQLNKTLKGHHGNVHAVAVTADGKILVSASLDMQVKLWSLPEGQEVSTLSGHTDWVNVVRISPDGKTLASGADNVRIWSIPQGKHLATLKAPGSPIRILAFTPDGKALISSHAGRLLFWDLAAILP